MLEEMPVGWVPMRSHLESLGSHQGLTSDPYQHHLKSLHTLANGCICREDFAWLFVLTFDLQPKQKTVPQWTSSRT